MVKGGRRYLVTGSNVQGSDEFVGQVGTLSTHPSERDAISGALPICFSDPGGLRTTWFRANAIERFTTPPTTDVEALERWLNE